MLEDFNINKFTAIGKHVLLRRDEPEHIEGGIVIPETSKIHGNCATILQIGQRVEGLRVGQRVFYLRQYTILPFKDRNIAMTDFDKIPAVLVASPGESFEEIHPLGNYVLIDPFPQITQKGAIHLPDQSIKRSEGGYVMRPGPDCKHAKHSQTAYYNTNKAIVCAEDDVAYHLVTEDEIDCLICK